jgi:DNA-directed RNA polymerase I, II, and III subunit RPABC2
MSYFSDDEDDLRNSVSSDRNDSDDDDIEPSISPNKKINKEELDDELADEDIDENNDETSIAETDEDDDIEAITDTDGEGEYDYDEIEEIGQESKKSESKKAESKKAESKKQGKSKNTKKMIDFEDDDEDDEDEDDNYLQKFDEGISKNYILNNHPECIVHNYHEVLSMCRVIRDSNGIIIDDLHKTLPYLTKYERARILGVRAKQINTGATPFVKLSEEIIDGYVIAEMELKEKKIPFIIKRPMPNGGSEYWFLKDLEDLSF